MKLHEAIVKLLQQTGEPMTTHQIADELNENGWYRKKDGSQITAFQVHGRTRNYAHIFYREGSTVSFIEPTITESKKDEAAKTRFVQNFAKSTASITKTSFEPISKPDTSVLILGTMPGDKSHERGEYYMHPRNRFWKVISAITNSSLPETYSEKKELLIESKIGIWDVAHKASRKGSLDSAIKDEEPNDIDNFIERHKNLKIVAFNGQKSLALFNKYFIRKKGIEYISLPSTSPANTGIDFESICKVWRQILDY